MQRYLTTGLAVVLAIYARLTTSIPVSGLAATADEWGLTLGADSTITVASPVSGSSTSSSTPRYPGYIKGIDTGLAATAILLMTGTYYLVIKHATPLGNYCKLPSEAIWANVQSLLRDVWPLAAVPNAVDKKNKWDDTAVYWNFTYLGSFENDSQQFDQLLYVGWNSVPEEVTLLDKKTKGQIFIPKSIQQCELQDQTDESSLTRRIWLRNKSSAIKNLVLLAIWEWVSAWLVIIMVIGTTQYNGFAAGDGNPDRYPRLVLILAYTFAFLVHFGYTWVCFCRTYTNVVLNGCWTLLGNANFAVKTVDRVVTTNSQPPNDGDEFEPRLAGYESSILGTTHLVPKYPIFHCYNYTIFEDDDGEEFSTKSEPVLLAATTRDPKDEAPPILIELQETEIESAEKAAEVALERIIFNATILLSISVVTGFSTWTTSQLTDATSTQLGSLALLASTASGIAAMLSSAQNLKGMVSNSWRYLQTTELILSGKEDPGTDKPVMGFTKKDAKVRSVTPFDFWTAGGAWEALGILIFGPAFILLPFGKERQGTPLERPFKIDVILGDARVFFSRTDSERVTVTLEPPKTDETLGEQASVESTSEINRENKGKSKETSENRA